MSSMTVSFTEPASDLGGSILCHLCPSEHLSIKQAHAHILPFSQVSQKDWPGKRLEHFCESQKVTGANDGNGSLLRTFYGKVDSCCGSLNPKLLMWMNQKILTKWNKNGPQQLTWSQLSVNPQSDTQFSKLKSNTCGSIGKAFGLFSCCCALRHFLCLVFTGVYTLLSTPGTLWALTFASASAETCRRSELGNSAQSSKCL